jgi:peptidoglycan/LPS O-acetylase OafA/YrhL
LNDNQDAPVHAEAVVAARAQPVAQRVEYVDGLRALAAIWVVLHHTLEVAAPATLLRAPVLGPVVQSLAYGQFPVMVFLMISGFVLYYPCVRRNRESPRVTTTTAVFYRRRVRRIAPPYLWAGAFCLAMVAVPALQGGPWVPLRDIGWANIGAHLGFVHNLFRSSATSIDYPMWSIGLEVQLYVLFPLLVWAFVKLGTRVVLPATLVLAVVVYGTYKHMPAGIGFAVRSGPLAYLEIFALGMFAAAQTVRGRTMAPRWSWVVIAIAGFTAIRFGSGNGLVHDLATAAAAFSILMLCVGAGSATSRALSTRWLVGIGVFSYSVYLIHAPVLHVLDLSLDNLNVPNDLQFALLVAIGLPIILAVSYGFHRAFERPFMRTNTSAGAVPVAATATASARATSPGPS